MASDDHPKGSKWAAKHYLNAFSKAKYTDNLSDEDKLSINDKIARMIQDTNFTLK